MSPDRTLPPQYDPKGLEEELYAQWERRGLFEPASDHAAGPSARPPVRPYVVQMPPPNVTAQLHMGHGLNNTVQDVVVRFERMRGRDTLWVPGTDHAGIATQNVVEKILAKEGKTRFDLGREAFERRVRHYVEDTGRIILDQLRALGSSCDWHRTYFTLDADLSRAVRVVFVSLYERGLIYRGKYIINWCPRCLTALSNEEVEKTESDGRLWHLRYPLDGGGHLVVATTRPETMLGDTGVAVHPGDARYRDLVGRMVTLPLTDRRIPVVADDAVDAGFGSGAVKLTPAHDAVDFEIARRHGLPPLDVMTDDAKMNDQVPERFRGLDRYEARKRVVAEFEAAGLLERIEPHRNAIGHCYRCDTVVEPRLSDQWFVRMKPLAGPALDAYRDGRIRFIPEHRGIEYALWMENIRDWCISRQLWWGHRIPVWYCESEDCGKVTVRADDPDACPACGGALRQDEDVLDTWFSSQLVPFSSLGWPDATPDLDRFYPGHTLVTAPEILFFWVARMIMAGLDAMGKVPFSTVYLHGTVRDLQHRKMSKSLNNGIDPLDVVSRYGADALRYTVVSGLPVGTDLILDPDDLEASFAPGRNFANKLWNIGRLILSHLPEQVRPLAGPHAGVVGRSELTLADRWIIARCEETVRDATSAYERFRLNDAALALHRFIWSDLADWYLEVIKPRLYGDQPGGDVARAVVARTFDVALRLLHPVMPFITETLWRRLPGHGEDDSIMVAAWPGSDRRALDARALTRFAALQELVGAIRSIRAEYGVQPGHAIRVTVSAPGDGTAAALAEDTAMVQRLAKVASLEVTRHRDDGRTATANAVLSDGTPVSVPLGDLVDLEKECARLGSERDRLAGVIAGQEAKLRNEQFVARAPAAVVEKERDKLAAWREQAESLTRRRRSLGCDG
jgi:valyl-tRNA synthetase